MKWEVTAGGAHRATLGVFNVCLIAPNPNTPTDTWCVEVTARGPSNTCIRVMVERFSAFTQLAARQIAQEQVRSFFDNLSADCEAE